jgi:hypothetical protein
MAGYIPYVLRLTKGQVDNMINNTNKNITAYDLISIDYAYHCQDDDYDNGLSFIDRLHWKLSIYFDIDWVPQDIKSFIISSEDNKQTYSAIINQILTQEMIDCYGI